MRDIVSLLLISVLVAGAATGLAASEELDVTATREEKKEVLFLIGGEIVMLRKWPLRIHVFDTGGLSGCSLAYSAEILDLEQVKIRREDGGPVLACGKTRSAGRAAATLSVTGGPPGARRREWVARVEGASMSLALVEPGEPRWTVTFPRP